jgi:hypothetical protein
MKPLKNPRDLSKSSVCEASRSDEGNEADGAFSEVSVWDYLRSKGLPVPRSSVFIKNLLLGLACITAVYACATDGVTDEDKVLPEFVSSSPSNGTINVLTTSSISFTFNEQMQTGISIDWSSNMESMNFSTSWSQNGTTITLVAQSDLPANAAITWTLNPSASEQGFKDSAGNALASVSGSFTTISPVIGTWGGAWFEHLGEGGFQAEEESVVFNSDSTGSSSYQRKSSDGSLSAGTDSFTHTTATNADGSFTLTRTNTQTQASESSKAAFSDDFEAFLIDATALAEGGYYRQGIMLGAKTDPSKTYSNSDLSGNYYLIRYAYGSAPSHAMTSGYATFDGWGGYTLSYSSDTDGTYANGTTSGSYSVASDGEVTVDSVLTGYLSGDGLVLAAVGAMDSSSSWETLILLKRGDRAYATSSDTLGAWALSCYGDDGGTSYWTTFGVLECDGIGGCTSNVKTQRDGVITYNGSAGISIAGVTSDGNFTSYPYQGASSPNYQGVMGNDGYMTLLNSVYASDPGRREFCVAVKCVMCRSALGGQ